MAKKSKKTKVVVPEWKPNNLNLECSGSDHGTYIYSVWASNHFSPVGTVWVRLTSNTKKESICEIDNIFVPHWARRKGIGTYMMDTLANMYDILKTGTGTKDGGMALMKSVGWKQNKQTGDWFFRKKS